MFNGFKVLLTVMFFQLSSCSTERTTVVVGEDRKVNVTLSNGESIDDVKAYYLSEQGIREEFSSYNFTDSNKSFSLELEDKHILENSLINANDQLVSMGLTPISYEGHLQSDIDPTIIGSVWMEFVEQDSTKIVQKISYAHWLMPVRRGDLLNSNMTFTNPDNIQFAEVGKARIKIVDASGSPIAGATVISVVEGTVSDGESRKKELRSLPQYRPRSVTSNQNGEVDLYPLYVVDDVVNARFIVTKQGFCTYSSAPIGFSLDRSTPYEVELKECTQISNIPGEFHARFGTGVRVNEEYDTDGQQFDVGYTNQTSITLRLDAANKDLRSIQVSVIEGHNTKNVPITVIDSIDLFTSEIEVPLPKVFSNTNTNNGDFLIRVASVTAKPEDEKNTIFLYGRKSIERPDVVNGDATRIFSETGIDGIISGLPGETFYVSTDECLPGYKIGVSIDFQPAIFSPCDDNKKSQFNTDDFDFSKVEEVDRKGFEATVKVFVTNLYDLTSLDDPASKNDRELEIDYGKPNIEDINFGIQYGIAKATDPAGTPFAYGEAITGGGYNVQVLTPSTIGDYVFRFAQASACKTLETEADASSLGATISSFAIYSDSVTTWTECKNETEANDVTLSADIITFPSQASENATFNFAIRDAANHESESKTIEIIPCPSDFAELNSSGIGVCWQP